MENAISPVPLYTAPEPSFGAGRGRGGTARGRDPHVGISMTAKDLDWLTRLLKLVEEALTRLASENMDDDLWDIAERLQDLRQDLQACRE